MKKTLLLTCIILALAAFVALPAPAALVAHWNFDEGPVDSVASEADSILDETIVNNGTPYGTSGPTYRADTPLDSGFSLEFNASELDNYVDVGHDSSLNLSSLFTITAWINVPEIKSDIYQTIIGKYGSTGQSWSFDISRVYAEGSPPTAGELRFIVFTPTQYKVYSNTPVPAGEWAHVAVVSDGTYIYFYLNGSPDGTYLFGYEGQVTAQDASIGRLLSSTFPQWLTGMIDDVGIYDEPLGMTQIQEIMNNGVNANPIPEPVTVFGFIFGGLFIGVKTFWQRIRKAWGVMTGK